MVELHIKIVREQEDDDFLVAYASGGDIGDQVIGGTGKTPYEALHDLVYELEVAGVWRPE
jgi:hypothetical protein